MVTVGTEYKYIAVETSWLISTDREADIVGREIDNIEEQYGNRNAPTILKEAYKRTSPLHKYFEWNDCKAAHAERLATARSLLRSYQTISVTYNDEPVRVPVNVNLKIETSDGRMEQTYIPQAEVLKDANLRWQQEQRLFRYLYSRRDEASQFEGLAGVVKALDRYAEHKSE